MSISMMWDLPSGAWDDALEARATEPPGSPYDEAGVPRVALLNATVQLRVGSEVLFPPLPDQAPGMELSLLDLACALADEVVGLAAEPEGTVAVYRQADDALEMEFERAGDDVVIRTNLDRSPLDVRVPAEALDAEVRLFLDRLLGEIDRRAPGLLDWHSLAPLQRYRWA